jgi:hypothetical protein
VKSRGGKFRIVVLFALLATCGLVSIAALTIAWNFDYFSWHSRARWLVHANEYKAKVMSEPLEQNGSLRHVEWDGWGFAGSDTTLYLVFDPKDQLFAASSTERAGKYPGIPCQVFRVRRLEKNWYTVHFYTDQAWNNCRF